MLLVAEDGSMNHADSYVEGVETWFSFQGADPVKGQVLLKVSEMEERPDYLTFKAIYKPWINVLWLGTFVLAFGFLLALVRNVRQGQ
jgi:cytochrome c-type biogenesis protein CcmF